MKREIKFRAWVKDEVKMVYSKKGENYISLDGSYYKIIYNMINSKGMILSKEDDNNIELMQYTGLKDKNEKEIYEGDIIKCTVTDNSADYLQIEAGDKHSVLRIISIPELYQEGLSDDGEIIGNIYENKELLKQQ